MWRLVSPNADGRVTQRLSKSVNMIRSMFFKCLYANISICLPLETVKTMIVIVHELTTKDNAPKINVEKRSRANRVSDRVSQSQRTAGIYIHNNDDIKESECEFQHIPLLVCHTGSWLEI